MGYIEDISEFLQKGKSKQVKALVTEALENGEDPKALLNDGLLSGFQIIGEKFKNNEIFVPEVLISVRALNAGLAILEPVLFEVGNEPVGKAVIGTVSGDLHDIGKNMVAMMLKGNGFEVHDLGVDVSPEAFADKAEEIGADVVCLSALLTTTMPSIGTTIELFKERGIRDKYIFMVGGAPVTQAFADEIGADYYTTDAATCGTVAKEAVLKKKA